MTKKALFAGAAAFSLLMYTSGAGADGAESKVELQNNSVGNTSSTFGNVSGGSAVSSNTLQQVNTQTVSTEGGEGFHGDSLWGAGMAFGNDTFRQQALDVNNFAQGVNQGQQGAISTAVVGSNNGR